MKHPRHSLMNRTHGGQAPLTHEDLKERPEVSKDELQVRLSKSFCNTPGASNLPNRRKQLALRTLALGCMILLRSKVEDSGQLTINRRPGKWKASKRRLYRRQQTGRTEGRQRRRKDSQTDGAKSLSQKSAEDWIRKMCTSLEGP